MNYSVLDHLEILTSKNNVEWCEKLVKEGVLDQAGTVNANKLNLMSGASVSSLLDAMQEADMNINEVYEHFNELHGHSDFRCHVLSSVYHLFSIGD